MSDLFLTKAENPVTDRPIKVGLLGSGFRARTILRVMSALPQWFTVVGVAARNADDRSLLASFGFPAYTTVEHLVTHGAPDFVVCTIPDGEARPYLTELAALHIPVLMETPPAGSLDDLLALYQLVQAGADIQVGEQYHLEPLVSAQLAVAASDMLGEVTEAQVSIAHDYHGISVLRRALGAGFAEPLITARQDARQIFPSPTRYRDPETLDLAPTTRTIAWFDYDSESGLPTAGSGQPRGSKLGIYDFDDSQYRSWVRSPSLVIRGPLGELRDDIVRLVAITAGDHSTPADDADQVSAAAHGAVATPMAAHLERISAGGAGSHEGLFLRGYQVFGEWVYYNVFLPARLADEELAIATMLARMGGHVLNGTPGPYSFAEAAQDQYLSLVMKEAARTGKSIRAVRQPWAG